jgi:hypothetical protein
VVVVFAIARSADTKIGSVSVELLLFGDGSVAPAGAAVVAVLLTVPVAVESSVAERVKVAVPFGSRLTVVLMLPLPPGLPQLDWGDAAHVHDPSVRFDGSASATVAPVTALGPEFETTIV